MRAGVGRGGWKRRGGDTAPPHPHRPSGVGDAWVVSSQGEELLARARERKNAVGIPDYNMRKKGRGLAAVVAHTHATLAAPAHLRVWARTQHNPFRLRATRTRRAPRVPCVACVWPTTAASPVPFHPPFLSDPFRHQLVHPQGPSLFFFQQVRETPKRIGILPTGDAVATVSLCLRHPLGRTSFWFGNSLLHAGRIELDVIGEKRCTLVQS